MGIDVRINSNAKGVGAEMQSEIIKRMHTSVNMVRSEVINNTLTGDRSGHIYKLPGYSRTYQASAPGEPPAVQFGALRQNVSSAVDIGTKIVGRVGVPSTARTDKGESVGDYALKLERGSKLVKPRPWLAVSFERLRNPIIATFGKYYRG